MFRNLSGQENHDYIIPMSCNQAVLVYLHSQHFVADMERLIRELSQPDRIHPLSDGDLWYDVLALIHQFFEMFTVQALAFVTAKALYMDIEHTAGLMCYHQLSAIGAVGVSQQLLTHHLQLVFSRELPSIRQCEGDFQRTILIGGLRLLPGCPL